MIKPLKMPEVWMVLVVAMFTLFLPYIQPFHISEKSLFSSEMSFINDLLKIAGGLPGIIKIAPLVSVSFLAKWIIELRGKR